MKKIILLILLSIILISCGKDNNNILNNENNIEIKKVALEGENIINNKNELTKEEFYKIKVPDDFITKEEFYDNFTDIKGFLGVIGKDKKLVEEEDFYNIWSDWLYGTTYTNGEVKKLRKCIKGEISYKNIEGIYKDICKGENKWIAIENINYFHIKDQLIKYKKIIDGEDFDCSYFIKDNYEIDDSYQKIFFKKNDYLICKLLKGETRYDIEKEGFYYIKARQLGKCKYLNDKNLVKLCLEEIKFRKIMFIRN